MPFAYLRKANVYGHTFRDNRVLAKKHENYQTYVMGSRESPTQQTNVSGDSHEEMVIVKDKDNYRNIDESSSCDAKVLLHNAKASKSAS